MSARDAAGHEAAWQAGVDAAEALAPESGLVARLDPADFGKSMLSVLASCRTDRRMPGPRVVFLKQEVTCSTGKGLRLLNGQREDMA
jgi:hypothetical protein